MQLTAAHNRDNPLTPAELLAALVIPPGPQEEAGIYTPRPTLTKFALTPFGLMETYPGYLLAVSHTRSLIGRPSLPRKRERRDRHADSHRWGQVRPACTPLSRWPGAGTRWW